METERVKRFIPNTGGFIDGTQYVSLYPDGKVTYTFRNVEKISEMISKEMLENYVKQGLYVEIPR